MKRSDHNVFFDKPLGYGTILSHCRIFGLAGLRIAAMLRPTRLVDEGEQVTLLCLSDGSPSPRFTWTRGNGVALPPAAVVDPATGTLVIGRVRPEDDGEYTCTAEDGVDVVSSSVSFDVCPDVRH